MFVDTHAHVNFNAFKEDSLDVLKECLDKNVWVINVGTQVDTSKRAIKLAEKFDKGVYAIVGLHPIHLVSQHLDEEETSFETREEAFDPEIYKELARSPKVVAIGECGLDYYRLPEGKVEESKEKQKVAFLQQINLAAAIKKPLVIHSRDAYDDIAEILKERRAKLPQVIIHSFIGSVEQAQIFLDLNCYISFNGIITYKPRKEKKAGQSEPDLQEAVKLVPLNRILLETDCPYLAPDTARGTRNTPLNVVRVAEKVAELKGISFDEVAKRTSENARLVFGI